MSSGSRTAHSTSSAVASGTDRPAPAPPLQRSARRNQRPHPPTHKPLLRLPLRPTADRARLPLPRRHQDRAAAPIKKRQPLKREETHGFPRFETIVCVTAALTELEPS